MVTNAEEAEAQPSTAESAVRSTISGHPRGAIRRIILYTVLAVDLVLVYALGGTSVAVVALAGALVPLMFLALTDQLA